MQIAFEDTDSRVCEQAVVLDEHWLPTSPIIQQQVIALANAPDPKLRFQVALSLGEISAAPEIIEPLVSIAMRAPADRWIHYAVISSVPAQMGSLLQRLLSERPSTSSVEIDEFASLVNTLATTIGSRRNEREIINMLGTAVALSQSPVDDTEALATTALQMAIVDGLGAGVNRRGGSLKAFLDKLRAGELALRDEVNGILCMRRSSPVPKTPRCQFVGKLLVCCDMSVLIFPVRR